MNNSFQYSLDEVDQIAAQIIKLIGKYRFFLLTGSLGAGKTTLVKSILRQVGVTDTITSPTFAYVASYKNSKEQNFYHFDLYRLNDIRNFIDVGFMDLINEPNSFYFIEWPEIINKILPEKLVCRLNLDYINEQNRVIFINIEK